MFSNSSVFVMTDKDKIYKIEVDNATQEQVCNSLSFAVKDYQIEGHQHPYEVNYKLEDDEFFVISEYDLPDEIKNAIKCPLQVESYGRIIREKESKEKEYPKIKCIFVGRFYEKDNQEYYDVAFQKYRSQQSMTVAKYNLIFTGNTFSINHSYGIGLTEMVDCFYSNDNLYFKAYSWARQILDLKAYYRIATDSDLKTFVEMPELQFQDADAFMNSANTYLRRKIAMINDSGVLKEYAPSKIKSIAKKQGIDITVQSNQIVIPSDKTKAKTVLAFLDEEAYRGPFTNNLIVANSKTIMK